VTIAPESATLAWHDTCSVLDIMSISERMASGLSVQLITAIASAPVR
jgi:hypothetical protein